MGLSQVERVESRQQGTDQRGGLARRDLVALALNPLAVVLEVSLKSLRGRAQLIALLDEPAQLCEVLRDDLLVTDDLGCVR